MYSNRFCLFCFRLIFLITVLAGCSKQDNLILKLDDAKHADIGVMSGTIGENIAKEMFPAATLKYFNDVMDAVTALKSSELDAIVTAYPTAFHVSKKNQELTFLAESLSNDSSCIAIAKGNQDQVRQLNRIIAELKSEGTLDDLKKRWFKPDLSPYQEKDIQAVTKGKVLKIGVSATREPLCFVDKSGRVTGHDGEFARIVAARLNRPVEFYNMKFVALIPALVSGKIDLAFGLADTPERKKSVDFTEPYFLNPQVLLVKKKSPSTLSDADNSIKIKTADDLKDKRLGVLLGSVHDKYAHKNYPDAKVMQYKSLSDMLIAIQTHKVDACFYVYESLLDLTRKNKEFGVLEPPLFYDPIAIGFNKNNNELREKFNSFLATLKTSGIYDDMVRRWIQEGSTKMPEIQIIASKDEIAIGIVSDKGLPFSAVKDNSLVGFDIELMERFAASLGRKPVFRDMEFAGLIAATATGKVDAIASTLMITEERKKQVAFSDPYYSLGTVVLALKSNIATGQHSTADSSHSGPSFLAGIAQSFHSNIIHENRFLLVLDGLKTTATIAVFSTIVGTLAGALVCFMRMSRKRLLQIPAKIYIAILRGTPVLVILMLIFYVVFASVDIDPVLVAVIAFAMNFAAYSAEIFRSGVEGIDRGQTEAGIALGFSKVQTFMHIILPQMVQRVLPVYKGEFISLVKMTSIVGYIAVQDLTKASDIIRSRTFDAFFPLVMVAVLYFLISWALLQLIEIAERYFDPKQRTRKANAA